MIARIVKIKSITGMEKQLTQMNLNMLVPINKEGALKCASLNPASKTKLPILA